MSIKHRLPVIILLAAGLLAVSTASILVRMIPAVPALTTAFWRMAIASTVLWLATGLTGRGRLSVINRRLVALAGVFLGLHFACFFGALKYTSIAHTTVLSALAPVFTVLFERFYLGQRWNKFIIGGLGLAFIGVIIIQGGGLGASSVSTTGSLLGIGASFFIAVVLLITKQVRRESRALIFSRSLYLAGALCALVMLVFSDTIIFPAQAPDFFWLLLLGVIPTVIGHTIFYFAIKFIRPTVVAAVPLGEPLVASTMAWIFFAERVLPTTVIGGLITLGGLLLIILRPWSANRQPATTG